MTTNERGYSNYRLPVPAAYDDIFSHFYFAENKTDHSITKTLLPSYQTILIFSFGSAVSLISQHNTEIELEKCLVLGPIKQSLNYSLPIGAEILVANFKDDAFYRFFGIASIAEQVSMNPDDLLNENCFTGLWNELNKINDNHIRVNHILEFCEPYLRTRNGIAAQLANFNDENLNPIKTIANENNQSERNIQLKHKKLLGYSAKEMNRYQRFLKAIELIQNIAAHSSKMDWFEIISECGYYDQSQLINDFRHYINLSPTKYLKFQQEICNPHS